MAKVKSVLLVDDSAADNFLHQELIEEEGFAERIDVVCDGTEALEFLQSGLPSEHFPPSIILLDINMPRMTGLQFLEHYEELPRERRAGMLSMLTTSDNPADQRKAQSFSVVDRYLSKPLTPSGLEELLRGRE